MWEFKCKLSIANAANITSCNNGLIKLMCPTFGLFKFIFNERFLFLFGSFFPFLSGIIHWSIFLKVGLRPAGCASDDFIPDRRRDIAVGSSVLDSAVSCNSFVCIMEYW